MRIHAFKSLTTILAAAGVLSPSILWAQTTDEISRVEEQALVVIDGNGIVQGQGYVTDSSIKVVNNQASVIGIDIVGDANGFDPTVNIHQDLEVDLSEVGSVGIQMNKGAALVLWKSAFIKAETAIRGSETLYLDAPYLTNDTGVTPIYEIVGGLDMKSGTIQNDFGADVHYIGIGDLGTYRAYAGDLTIGRTPTEGGETFLRIGSLELADGASVTVAGDKTSTDGVIADNRVLLVKQLTKLISTSDSFSGKELEDKLSTLKLTGESTLVLGTSLTEGDDVAGLRKDVYEIVNSAKVVTGSLSKATLITGTDFQIEEGFSIVVGEQIPSEKADGAGIHVGNDGRWVVYFNNEDNKTTTSDPVSLNELAGFEDLSVTAEQDAELILYNWNGQEFAIGDFSAENVHAFGGARLEVNNGIASRLWCKDFAGLRASSIVGYVETAENTEMFKALPGYRFIMDTFDEEIVGRDAYANVIDGALFLPITSGIATAGERVFERTVNTVMTHDLSLFEGKGHWWVEAESAQTDASEIFSGGSGHFGFEADVTSGTLGYDFALGGKWTATAAVSFAGIDTQSKGAIENTTADMSMAAVSLGAARNFDDYTLRFGVTYSRASGDVEQRSVGHRLEADTDIDFLSIAARMTARSFTQFMHFEPYVQVALNGARLRDGVITDSDSDGTVSGEAFDTSANDRLWGTVETGADVGCSFKVRGQYSVKPTMGASIRSSFGQTDWKIRSALFDGSQVAQTSYDSAQRFAARIRVGVELADSGFSEIAPGFFSRQTQVRVEPYAWKIILTGEYEAASDSEKSSALCLQFRQLL